MYYRGYKIKRFLLQDCDNCPDPHMLLDDRGVPYEAPNAPHIHMSASQVRDMIDVVRQVCGRVGGYPDRIQWWVELTRTPGVLVPVDDYEHLTDCEDG